MADDLDRTLATTITRLAEQAVPDTDSWPETFVPTVPERAGRRGSRVLVAASAIVVLVMAALVATRPGDDSHDVVAGDGLVTAVLVPPAPINAVTGMSTAVIDGRVLVWGGRAEPAPEHQGSTVGGPSSAEGAVYDVAAGAWTLMAPSPLSARIEAGTVVLDGEMYVIGGLIPMSDDGPPRDGAAYDPATDTWRSIADLPEDVCVSGLIGVVADQIIAVGGCRGGGETLPAASYDAATDTWTVLPSAPLLGAGPRGGPRVIALDSGLYFPNGTEPGLLFSVEEQRWVTVPGFPEPPAPSPGFIWSFAMAAFDDSRLIALASADAGPDGPTETYLATLDIAAGWSALTMLRDERDAYRPDGMGGSVVVGRTMMWPATYGVAWMDVGSQRPSAADREVDGVRLDRGQAAWLPLGDHRVFVFGGQLGTGDVPPGRVDPAIVTFP